MSLNSSKAKTKFLRLSMGQVLLLIAIFAVASAVWMNRLHEAGQEDILFRAATQAGLEARRLNRELLEAIREKDSETVGTLLDAGANPNYPEADPRPLEIAIGNADIESIRLLVAAGASVAERGDKSPFVTVILAPIEHLHKVMIFRELLVHGADIQQDQQAMDVCYGSGSPEIIAILRQRGVPYGPREMALAGDMDGLRAALVSDPSLLSRPLASYCMSSKTLLGVALRQGHEDLANWMLDEGAPLEVHEISKGTALHLAAVGDCARIISRLCQMGCDPNVGDDSGETPLDYCLSIASPATIQELLSCGADASRMVPRLGNTSLHRAILRYDSKNESNPSNGPTLEIIALLLDAGADCDIADGKGQSARDLARTRSSSVLRLFLDR